MNKKYIALVVLPITVVLFFVAKKTGTPQPDSFQPSEMAAAQFAQKDVVADLGGVPVSIPKHFADYVEYDGDPGFGEKRKEPKPKRTQQSKLSSFGFYVRYPDMVGLSTPELRQEKKKESIYTTMWISVGLHAGSMYKGKGTLDRLANGRVVNQDAFNKDRQYEQLPMEEYGLTIYASHGIDPKTNKPYREGRDAEDVFIHRDENGKVTTFITCSNRLIKSAPCTQWIDLEPLMKADVYISYRRDLLPEWQKIQESVTQLIYNFKSTTPQ